MPYSDDDDVGNTSFVPLSLADVTAPAPQRTYTSRAPPGRARPSHAHSNSFSSATASKERTLQAKKDAAAMMESLGMGGDVTSVRLNGGPGPLSTSDSNNNNNNRREEGAGEGDIRIVRLKTALSDQDQMIESLRRQVSGLMSEKTDLGRKVERLEKERAAQSGRTIGAGEMEDLEKAFASQEMLLSGYQRDAERSMKTIEDLKKQQRRLVQFLEKLYGSTWEQDLSLHLDRPTTTVPIPIPYSINTPRNISHKLSSRPSLSTAPSSYSLASKGSYKSENSDTPSHSNYDGRSILQEGGEDARLDSPSPMATRPGEKDEELRAQLESVQALLRGMERRILAREVELEAGEKRAKMGMREAEKRRIEVDDLVRERSRT